MANEQEELLEQGVHSFTSEKNWVKPEDPLLLERLEWYKDQKLALMMHWGPYSQWGVVESWALSDEDASWSRSEIDWVQDGEEFRRQYWNLGRTFNPVRFLPEEWAALAAEGGFKYLVFTTKHHDGFCMWDTKTTDNRITGPDCPFRTHRYADVCRNLFDAFRARGMAIAAYFSKADWNTPTYWAPDMEMSRHPSRNPTYDPAEHPEIWERFVRFTHEQIMELMSQYGRIDILWLDAGWVAAKYGQDIRLGEVVDRSRELQPWLICADRTVGGPYENYVTPEQTVPQRPMGIPWESCITLGTSFSFKYEDQYKSPRQVVNLLVDIVAKGGNLALNIGPQPDGRLPAGAVETVRGLGAWLKTNGEAIYGTRPHAPWRTGDWAFTAKGSAVYCFRLYPEEGCRPAPLLDLPLAAGGAVELLGYGALPVMHSGGKAQVLLPDDLLAKDAPPALVFKIGNEGTGGSL